MHAFVMEVYLQKNPSQKFVCTEQNKEQCQKMCDKRLTPCDWVGNSMHHACLQDGGSVPQRVYNGMNGSKLRLAPLKM